MRSYDISALGGSGITANNSFTPVAAAYAANDVIGTAPKEFAFTFSNGTAVPVGSLIRVTTAVIKIDRAALIANEAAYSLRNYSVTPPTVRSDNAAWTLASGDLSAYRGTMLIGTPVDEGGALFVKTKYIDEDIKLTTSGVFAELTNAGGVTYTAEAIQVFLYGMVL